MGLEKLVEEVRRRGQDEARAASALAKGEADDITKKGEAQGEAVIKEAQAKGAEAAKAHKAEVISRARSQGKRILADAKKQAIERHLEAVWERILEMRQKEEYLSLMRHLAEDAVAEAGKGFRLCSRKEDAKLFGRYKPETGLDSAGGFVVEDAKGRLRIDCTLEALFEEKKGDLTGLLYRRLFGERR